uniref:G-protein coupled receptors family 1 profile domain-containing protein n=1 Tax=Gopherus agassizii TaxID=38772 RepID=A0A452J656_9SAUR
MNRGNCLLSLTGGPAHHPCSSGTSYSPKSVSSYLPYHSIWSCSKAQATCLVSASSVWPGEYNSLLLLPANGVSFYLSHRAVLLFSSSNIYAVSCFSSACPLPVPPQAHPLLFPSPSLAAAVYSLDNQSHLPQPLYKNVVTPRRAAAAIACCWIVSLLVGLTPIFGWNNLNKMRRTQEANASHTAFVIRCQFENVISMEYMVYFNFFVWVLPPLLLMLIIYLEVFNLIRKQLDKKVSSNSSDPQKYYGKELKIAKSLALVLFLFALSWLPLHTLNCITLFCPSCQTPSILTYIAIFLTHGNSAMNPIVYAFRIQKFRTTFLQIWHQYICPGAGRLINERPF